MVTLVVTEGPSSLDFYSQKLAEKLDVPKFHTDIYRRIREKSNISWFSKEALKAIQEDCNFIRALNRLEGIVHLPNQHLGRYGNFLDVPYIITVHDVIRYLDLKGYGTYIHHPNLRDRFYLRLDYRGIRKAVRIIVVSQATKRDLMRYLKIPAARISVVYEGVDPEVFRPSHSNGSRYPYILFVGSEHPRKNLATLLKAFKRLKERPEFKDLKLVKVGRAGGKEADFRRQTMEVVNSLNLRDEVIFTEIIPEEELQAYYCGAECFVLPSLYEGFGFPPLEAMACGCPVITSNGSSLPELVGEAAVKIAPYDDEELARALEKVLTDKHFRESLIGKGIEQAARFSWAKTAERTLKVYREVEKELSH